MRKWKTKHGTDNSVLQEGYGRHGEGRKTEGPLMVWK